MKHSENSMTESEVKPTVIAWNDMKQLYFSHEIENKLAVQNERHMVYNALLGIGNRIGF